VTFAPARSSLRQYADKRESGGKLIDEGTTNDTIGARNHHRGAGIKPGTTRATRYQAGRLPQRWTAEATDGSPTGRRAQHRVNGPARTGQSSGRGAVEARARRVRAGGDMLAVDNSAHGYSKIGRSPPATRTEHKHQKRSGRPWTRLLADAGVALGSLVSPL